MKAKSSTLQGTVRSPPALWDELAGDSLRFSLLRLVRLVLLLLLLLPPPPPPPPPPPLLLLLFLLWPSLRLRGRCLIWGTMMQIITMSPHAPRPWLFAQNVSPRIASRRLIDFEAFRKFLQASSHTISQVCLCVHTIGDVISRLHRSCTTGPVCGSRCWLRAVP
jgi:hypothetical protein